MKGFILGVTVTLALLMAAVSFAKIDQSALMQAILPQLVVQIEQDVPVTAYLQMPGQSGEAMTVTLPLTLAVDLRIGIASPLSVTLDVAEGTASQITIAQASPPTPSPASSPLLGLDRTDPEAVASTILQLYKDKDLAGLAEVSTEENQEMIREIARLGTEHSRYQSIFEGWRYDAALMWDGTIEEVRYRYTERSSGDWFEAHAKFLEISDSEIATVVMKWENDAWVFEDINSPSQASFERGIEEFSLDPTDY